MATMNIKDPEVHRMARELAARRQTTVTGAVREALTEALAEHDATKAGTAERLLALAAQSQRIVEPVASDVDLYDENGLPR